MRILIATENRAVVGGVELYLRAILPQLIAAGHQIGVLTEDGNSAPVDCILAGCPAVPTWDAAGRRIPELMHELGSWGPQVVYQHGLSDPDLEATLAKRFPTVFFPHNYHGTCVSGTKCHSRPAYQACQRALGLGCLVAYIPRGCGGWNPITMLRLYNTQRYRRSNFDLYRAVLVVSRQMAEEFCKNGVDAGRLQLISYFASEATPDLLPPTPRVRTDRVIFVGRITRLKGLDHLIAALPIAALELGRRLTLVVAGDGPERTAAELEARRQGVAAEFLGWIDPQRRTAELRNADVLAVPSVWPEPFGQVGVQAGCVGLPAVGYATGGITDWLVPGVSGESAPGDHPDPIELSAAIVRALSSDSHRHRLAVGAWEMSHRYSVDQHLAQLNHIFQIAVSAPAHQVSQE